MLDVDDFQVAVIFFATFVRVEVSTSAFFPRMSFFQKYFVTLWFRRSSLLQKLFHVFVIHI